MMYTQAITRKPGRHFDQGLTTSDIGKPCYDTLLQQHDHYVRTLRDIGLSVIVLEALPGYPDAYFVEDTAVITPEVAIITNPGAKTRKGEIISMEKRN